MDKLSLVQCCFFYSFLFIFYYLFFYLVLIKFALTFLPVANVQIKLLFQTGFDEAELRSYTSVIHANVYQTIKVRNTEKGVLVYSLLPGALRELLTKVITLSMNWPLILLNFLQVLHDGSQELAQNEADFSKYAISPENKVWICLSLYFSNYVLAVLFIRKTSMVRYEELALLVSYTAICGFVSRLGSNTWTLRIIKPVFWLDLLYACIDNLIF